ncbi:MAG: hypothetical protein NW201_13215, partial [Gemmatimonadales bacterium]|nr:hypothetical protein [Gemmatimonadales bacterium]
EESEEGARRGRRRGRGRGRSGEGGGERAERGAPPAAQPERRDGGLTLARGFQLLARALTEFRAPVGHERLRQRLLAMHGREDVLLVPERFEKFLRQANDAEVADVRSLPDGGYDVTSHSTGTSILRAEQAGGILEIQPPVTGESPAAPRGGLRYRKGAQATRVEQIPLIGVVSLDDDDETPAAAAVEAGEPEEPVVAEVGAPESEAGEAPAKKPRRGSRGGRAKGAKGAKAARAVAEAPAAPPAEVAEEAPAAKPKARRGSRGGKGRAKKGGPAAE